MSSIYNLRDQKNSSRINPKNVEGRRSKKIRAEIKEIENKDTMERSSKARSWFFVKTNKIDRPLVRLIKKKREKAQITRIRSEKGDIATPIEGPEAIFKTFPHKMIKIKIVHGVFQ